MSKFVYVKEKEKMKKKIASPLQDLRKLSTLHMSG